jgi:two-component system sensor histidine kinase/response regulator
MMPDIDGFETCVRLKKDDRTRNIPIIFMTALSDPTDKIRGFEVGGVDYITKPLQHEEVIARVNTHLAIQKLQNQLRQKNECIQQQNEHLRDLNTQLQELNASKDKFFSIIAHDLRSPFSGLFALTELIIEEIDQYSKDQIKKVVLQLQNATETLYELLGNLLTWARIQQGLIECHPQIIDIRYVVVQNVDLFTPYAQQKKITLSHSIQEHTPAYADVNLVNTVVRNLVSNGLKFTPEGGCIVISVTHDEHEVCVSIADTGIGIPKEKLPDLFRVDVKYQRAGTAGEKGTGLGLVLCKELIEQNGGSVRVTSEEGKGTTFTFTLPKKPKT